MKKVIHNGVETPVSQVAIICKVHITVMYDRIRKGLTQETGLFHKGKLPRRCEVCVLDGKEIAIIEASEIVGLSITTIRRRLKEGLTQETGLFRKYLSIKEKIKQEKVKQEKRKLEKIRIEKMNQDQQKKDYEKTGQSVDKIEQIREKRRQRQYKIDEW